MKKLILLVMAMTFTGISIAQKAEMKALDKAVKSSDFAAAKTAVSSAESLIGSMDDKTKAKFYFLKTKAFYANGGASSQDLETSYKTIDILTNFESSIGKKKYSAEVEEIKLALFNHFVKKANDAYNAEDYKSASKGFAQVYNMSKKDTIYLYYAAATSVNSKDYNQSLIYYEELKKLGYTGIKMNYYAKNKETGVEELFGDKNVRDLSVKSKQHIEPRDEKTTSKKAEIAKNIALIYIAQGKDDKALESMADARKENPTDVNLVISEANIYFKLGDNDKFKSLMKEAAIMDPNNPELFYNLGVLSAEVGDNDEAYKYYSKAIEIDPNYSDAYNNLAVLILAKESTIVEEMNSLGTSSADNKRYDVLKEKRSNLYREAIPYLSKSLELKSDNVDTIKTLMNIYSVLGENDKYKEMKTKLDSLTN